MSDHDTVRLRTGCKPVVVELAVDRTGTREARADCFACSSVGPVESPGDYEDHEAVVVACAAHYERNDSVLSGRLPCVKTPVRARSGRRLCLSGPGPGLGRRLPRRMLH